MVCYWHFTSVRGLQRHGSYWGESGPIADIAKPSRLRDRVRLGRIARVAWRGIPGVPVPARQSGSNGASTSRDGCRRVVTAPRSKSAT